MENLSQWQPIIVFLALQLLGGSALIVGLWHRLGLAEVEIVTIKAKESARDKVLAELGSELRQELKCLNMAMVSLQSDVKHWTENHAK